MITVLFPYRPVAWCFLRGMKFLSILMVGVALATLVVADDKAEIERLKISRSTQGETGTYPIRRVG